MVPFPGTVVARVARLPNFLLQAPLDLAVARALRRHPALLRRLGWSDERLLVIEPDDLPIAFVVRCSARRARIAVVAAGAVPPAEARIRGPIGALLDLLVGDDDGDTQFFSRVLGIEGDTELVVALRNAIDDAELDPLADFLPLPDALLPLARRGVAGAVRLARRASADLSRLDDFLGRLTPVGRGIR